MILTDTRKKQRTKIMMKSWTAYAACNLYTHCFLLSIVVGQEPSHAGLLLEDCSHSTKLLLNRT